MASRLPGGRAGRGARTDVELVEDDGFTGAHDAGDDPAHARSAPRSRPSRRRVLTGAAAAVAVLVAVAVVGQGVETARERDRLATLTLERNAVAPLDGPPAALWTSPDGELLWTTARTPDGLIVSVRTDDDGSSTVRALDPATGDAAWERPLLTASDADPVPDQGTHGAHCRPHGADGDLLVCLASDARYVVEGDEVRYSVPTVTLLLLLDPSDGSVVADLSDALRGTGAAPSVVVLADLAVVSSVVDDETRVVAVAPDGSVAWRLTVPAPAPSSPPSHGYRAEVLPLGDDLLVATPDQLHLVDATGATVRRVDLRPGELLTGTSGATALAHAGPGQDVLGRSSDAVVAPGEGTRAVRADHVSTLPGRWVRTEVNDGSADGMLLTVDRGGLHAWDTDGSRRWTADLPPWSESVHVLAGRVHVMTHGELVTLDARTGTELWRRDGITAGEVPVTDGRHLLARAGPVDAPGTELVAVDLSDGSDAWRTAYPAGVDSLHAVFGMLVGLSYGADGSDWSVTVLG